MMAGNYLLKLGRLYGDQHVIVSSGHNSRAMYADGASDNGKIDSSRSHLNYSLGGQTTPEGVMAVWSKRQNDAGITRPLRKGGVSAVEFVFSLNPDTRIDLRKYFTDCVEWVAKCCGGIGNVLSADVHLDQDAPHIHILVVPVVNGKMQGSAMYWGDLYWGASSNHAKQHRDFHACVGVKYGLKKSKATAKLSKAAQAAQAAQVMLALEAMIPAERWEAVKSEVVYFADSTSRLMVKLGLVATVKPGKSLRDLALSKGAGPTTKAAEKRRDDKFLNQSRPNAIGFPVSEDASETLFQHKPYPVIAFLEKGDESDQSPSSQKGEQKTNIRLQQTESETVRPQPRAAVSPPDPQTESDLNLPEPAEFTRVRDSDLDPGNFNTDTGEWAAMPAVASVQTKSEKTNAQAWVTGQLTGLMAKRSTRAGVYW